MDIENALHTYPDAKLIMTPSGELCIALHIHTNEDDSSAFSVEAIPDVKIVVGFIEPMGYLVYHPHLDAGMTIYFKSLDMFEDLGKL